MSFTDKLKFASKRFSDLGFGTSPQVNRLLFKNQEFREFASVNYLVEKDFIIPQEYFQFINKPICEEKPATKPTESTSGGGPQTEEALQSIQKEIQKLEALSQTNPELNDTIEHINNAITQIQTDANDQKYIINKSFDYFKLNDKINMPFENPHFFNFLHMFKYTLSKGYSKFRMMRVYRILDGLMDALSNTYYFEGDGEFEIKPETFDVNEKIKTTSYNAINNKYGEKRRYYPNTFLYAYRRNFVNRIKSFMGIGDQKGDDAFRVKNPCKEGSDTKNMYRQLKSFMTWSMTSNDRTGEMLNNLGKKIEEKPNAGLEANIDDKEDNNNNGNQGEDLQNDNANGSTGGGTRKYRKMQSKRRFKRRTKKIHGGFVLYTSRLYRALNMHISTTNLYNYSSSNNDSYGLGMFNKLTSVEKADQIPAYVVKEQIRCLILADIYLTSVDPKNKINNYYRLIKRENTYDKLTELIQSHVNAHPEFKEYIDIINKIDLLDTTVVDPKYNTFMIYNPAPKENIHRIVKMLLERVHNKVRYFSLDMTYIKKTFRHSTNMAFLNYTQNLFKDPTTLPNDNLKARLEKYYQTKGLTKEYPVKNYPNDKLNEYYKRKRQFDNQFKKKNAFKKDVIDFLYNFTFCVVMTPHFACSQIGGLLVGSGLNSYANLAQFSSNIVMSVVGNSGTMSSMVSATFMGTSIAASALSSIANTPNCYYSMGLMMYTLLFSLKPFMPQEGFAWRNPYMARSDRLNSLFYRPPQPGVKRSLRDLANNHAIDTGKRLLQIRNRFFTRKQPPAVAETQEQGTQTNEPNDIPSEETGMAPPEDDNEFVGIGSQTDFPPDGGPDLVNQPDGGPDLVNQSEGGPDLEQQQRQQEQIVPQDNTGGKRRTRRKRKYL